MFDFRVAFNSLRLVLVHLPSVSYMSAMWMSMAECSTAYFPEPDHCPELDAP